MPNREGDLHVFRKAIHQALRNRSAVDETGLQALSQWLVFQRAWRNLEEGDFLTRRDKANRLISGALDALEEKHEFSAQLLRSRFIEGLGITQLALTHNFSADQLNRRQREAIQQLSMILWSKEMRLRSRRLRRVERRLPPRNFDRLFGMEAQVHRLSSLLAKDEPPHLVALTGLGGQGKTALAQHVVRQLAADSIKLQIHWLDGEALALTRSSDSFLDKLAVSLLPNFSGEMNPFSALHGWLKGQRHFVVMDGIPWLSPQTLAQLYELADPTRFLLIIRQKPPAASFLHQMRVPALEFLAAASFIQHYAAHFRTSFRKQELDQIFEIAGGHPGGLKCLLDMLPALPLGRALDSFRDVENQVARSFFSGIYAECLGSLGPEARQLLLSGAEWDELSLGYDDLRAVSELTEPGLQLGLEQLVKHCLLEVEGSLSSPRYRMQRLTRTFLRSGMAELLRTTQ